MSDHGGSGEGDHHRDHDGHDHGDGDHGHDGGDHGHDGGDHGHDGGHDHGHDEGSHDHGHDESGHGDGGHDHGHDEGSHDHGHGHGHGGADDHDHTELGDHGGADLIDRSAAVDRVLALRSAALDGQAVEAVDVGSIAGRTLAESVVADRDRPEWDHSTMDGYAFDATDDYPLEVVDAEVYPEDDPPTVEAGQAVPIATGAPLPERANAVLKVEEATVEDDRLEGAAIDPGTYVYERASNVAAGEQLFAAGEVLSPKDAVFLRDLGRESVPVRERFRVGLLATGTEIHEGRQTDLDSPMLAGLVRSWGHEATVEGTVPDRYDRVRDRIAALAGEYDVVVTTGGTSVGKKDHAIRALAELGEVDFHRVAVRPGKPIAAARLPDHGAVAFAVPGKPVGAHTIAVLVMGPFFTGDRRLPSVPATAARDVDLGPSGFEYAIPVTLSSDAGDPGDGAADDRSGPVPSAMPLGHADSALSVYDRTFDPSVLSSSTRATRADGFVLARSGLSAGETVRVHPYSTVER